MAKTNQWQYRKADTIEERFGLLDNPKMGKYRRMPTFIDPIGEAPKDKPLTAIGLTCGIGSMLVGAQQMGFRVVGNVEWRDYYRFKVGDFPNTFSANFPGAFMARGVNDVDPGLFPDGIDFAAGHPECGRYSNLSYSVGGDQYRATRGTDVSDIPLFLKLVAMFRPRFFLMDDLPDSFEAFPMSEYIKILPDYDLFPEWVSNWGYGNIQRTRNRMFVVGALKSEKFAFVAQEKEHNLVLSDVIADLARFEDEVEIANHQNVDLDYTPGRYVNTRFYGDRPTWNDVRGMNNLLGKNLPYYTPEGEVKIRPGTKSPNWDEFCPVLSGGFNPLHPLRKLPLSIRERARIQGFPDDFVFYFDDQGPFRDIWEPYNSDGQRGIKQTGKAMPLQFCTYVAAQVKAHIEGKPWPTKSTRVIKPNPKVDAAKRAFCELSGYSNPEAVKEACWLNEPVDYYRSML